MSSEMRHHFCAGRSALVKVGVSLTCDVDEGRGVLEPDDTVAPSQHQAHANHTSHCMSHRTQHNQPSLYIYDSSILRQTTASLSSFPADLPLSEEGSLSS